MIDVYEDAARFDPLDRAELVAAAFACPTCLGTPDRVVLEAAEILPSATCRCDACARSWTVHLDERQAMRLALAPPAELPRPLR